MCVRVCVSVCVCVHVTISLVRFLVMWLEQSLSDHETRVDLSMRLLLNVIDMRMQSQLVPTTVVLARSH